MYVDCLKKIPASVGRIITVTLFLQTSSSQFYVCRTKIFFLFLQFLSFCLFYEYLHILMSKLTFVKLTLAIIFTFDSFFMQELTPHLLKWTLLVIVEKVAFSYISITGMHYDMLFKPPSEME